ncbi:unnamed protein product [Amoebophrya sp. A25]|nr:unnamed protein product [Amoebophrya sp. A25]|eukprot:GSA25T00007542001.1
MEQGTTEPTTPLMDSWAKQEGLNNETGAGVPADGQNLAEVHGAVDVTEEEGVDLDYADEEDEFLSEDGTGNDNAWLYVLSLLVMTSVNLLIGILTLVCVCQLSAQQAAEGEGGHLVVLPSERPKNGAKVVAAAASSGFLVV